MKAEEALRDLADALAAIDQSGSRDARLRAARQQVVARCVAVLGVERAGQPSIAAVIHDALAKRDRVARRISAVLVVQALAVPGLVPAASAGDVCALAEDVLRDVLLRCAYPFGAATPEKMAVLQGLHRNIGELLQPLEPTFPNWQGLYAG
jgi:hypothetical protein